MECGEINSLVSISIVVAASPRDVIVAVLVTGIWVPIVVVPTLVVSGLVTLAGAVSSAVGAIMAMVLVALVVLWIITHGVVYW